MGHIYKIQSLLTVVHSFGEHTAVLLNSGGPRRLTVTQMLNVLRTQTSTLATYFFTRQMTCKHICVCGSSALPAYTDTLKITGHLFHLVLTNQSVSEVTL